MLILTRQVGQEIVIGEAIRVEVLGIKQGTVRLGIKAPKQCKVLRSELLDRPRNDADSNHDSAPSAADTQAQNQ